MFGWMCHHPFSSLIVNKDVTEEEYPDPLTRRDFLKVTISLRCTKCHTDLDMKYAKMKGGVNGFLNRGPGPLE